MAWDLIPKEPLCLHLEVLWCPLHSGSLEQASSPAFREWFLKTREFGASLGVPLCLGAFWAHVLAADCRCPPRRQQRRLKDCALVTPGGDLHGAPDSWPRPGPALQHPGTWEHSGRGRLSCLLL